MAQVTTQVNVSIVVFCRNKTLNDFSFLWQLIHFYGALSAEQGVFIYVCVFVRGSEFSYTPGLLFYVNPVSEFSNNCKSAKSNLENSDSYQFQNF